MMYCTHQGALLAVTRLLATSFIEDVWGSHRFDWNYWISGDRGLGSRIRLGERKKSTEHSLGHFAQALTGRSFSRSVGQALARWQAHQSISQSAIKSKAYR
ncbi:hypothetical protein CLAIMM_00037 [Cladophialophora immunda]|nr:hypothetical protein CLAIMM_00037 [Cladophialophora immunda]